MPELFSGWAARALESALDAVVTIDAAGAVVQFNRAAERMFGYDREDAVGRPLAELIIPPELRSAHWAGLLRVVGGGSPRILDTRLTTRAQRRDGRQLPVELTVTRVSESPPLFTGFIRDLSELRLAERRSREMARHITAAEGLAGVGTWELDLGSARGRWSDGMYRMSARDPRTDPPGVELLLDTAHPEDRPRLAALLTRVIERPESIPEAGLTAEYRAIGPDGSVREIRARGRIERDEHGAPARWVGVAHDITEQRWAARELQAHAEVARALHDWDSFEEGVAGLLRRLGDALDFSVGSLWVHDPSEDRLTCRAFWSPPGVDAKALEAATRGRAHRPGEGAPGQAWASGAPVLVADPPSGAGVRSEVAFPAIGPAGPVAVLAFACRDRPGGGEQLIETLDGIGRALGPFLARRAGELQDGPLSPRELEVLRLAAAGNSGPRIAELLIVSPATVKTHFENIYAKLGVGDRAGAVALALRTGLIT